MIELRQKATFLESDVATPISLFLERVGQQGSGLLLESAEVGGRWGRHSLVCAGALLRLGCDGGRLALEYADSRFEPLGALSGKPFLEGLKEAMGLLRVLPDPALAGLPPITRALYGYLGYGLASLMEPSLGQLVRPEAAEASLVLPAKILLFDHAYNSLVELCLGGQPLGQSPSAPAPGPLAGLAQGQKAASPGGAPLRVKVSPGQEGFCQKVREGKRLIAEGELIQLVLSVGYECDFGGDPFDVYRRLRRLNPSPYMFYLQEPGNALVVSSPEVMVSCSGNRLRLCPIAGTKPRGQDDYEDDLFEAALVDDPKEQSEHVMLVDLGRNDLGRVAAPGSVEVERFMEVERFSHVMHLTSQLGADLAPGRSPVDVVAATFPAGTLSGAPKIRAMELIAAMEGVDRGPYGGAIGWLGLDTDSVNLDLGIAIRGLWVRDGKARFRAGAGIVYDSDPLGEWAECQAKAAAVLAALGGKEAKSVAVD
ncbi:MAG: anthranilate synthase component I family protein [Deltaproteobacteria bacterium]|jgi:anthranilate synthase component 1|nr:anthranilate synthase component I family protein [Deltaproteobacteria bacterium]